MVYFGQTLEKMFNKRYRIHKISLINISKHDLDRLNKDPIYSKQRS